MILNQIVYYIDPGTGSMLFTVLVGILSASIFAWKKLIIKMKFLANGGRIRNTDLDKQKYEFVIFSDHKRYWNVFKPICDEFEKRQMPLEFWTASPDDPALSENYEFIHCEFIGEGNAAFAKLNLLSANICLSTTPGLDVYQWKRSKSVNKYIHILHSVDSAAAYRMFGLDYYDDVLLSGNFQIDEIRELERKRNITEKKLAIVGCTYMDSLADRLKKTEKDDTCHSDDYSKTVLLAPSWGQSGILSKYGTELIDSLIDTGYMIIVRPHPQSMVSEKNMMDSLLKKYPETDAFRWNFDNDNFEVLKKSDVLISDFSGILFDYTLVFDKPVIYTSPEEFDASPYDAFWLDHKLWKFEACARFGIELSKNQFGNMKKIIDDAIKSSQLKATRDEIRKEAWEYRGSAAYRVADFMIEESRVREKVCKFKNEASYGRI